MVQEAKPSCRGRWYLLAGRMEPNETIVVSSITHTVFTFSLTYLTHTHTGCSNQRGERGVGIDL